MDKKLAEKYYYRYDDYGDRHYFLGGDRVPVKLIPDSILSYIKYRDRYDEIKALKVVQINLKRKMEFISNKIEGLEENLSISR